MEHRSMVRAILAGRILPAMSFSQRVWALVARIPQGRVATYGQVARRLGSRGCRAVGMALNRNPYAPRVPCHRVVGAGGELRGFAGGLDKKRRLLLGEGVKLRGDRVDLTSGLAKL